jgi:hypothetical protein
MESSNGSFLDCWAAASEWPYCRAEEAQRQVPGHGDICLLAPLGAWSVGAASRRRPTLLSFLVYVMKYPPDSVNVDLLKIATIIERMINHPVDSRTDVRRWLRLHYNRTVVSDLAALGLFLAAWFV